MSPFPAQCTWSKATWEIMESEHIDFPATDPGSSPDEELQRKCNNLILLQPGPVAPAALSLPGWGHRAAPTDLGALHSWAPVWHCQAAPSPHFPTLVPLPSSSAHSGHIFGTCRDHQLPQSPRVFWKGVSHRYGYSCSQLTPIRARDKDTHTIVMWGRRDPMHVPYRGSRALG